MPIEVFCDSCQKKLRVPDTAAGKRIKCPKCQGVISVPAAPGGSGSLSGTVPTVAKSGGKSSPSMSVPKTSTPKSGLGKRPVLEQWHVQTEDGQQYGPVSRQELDQWHADGRITVDTQLLRDGGEQWQWASDLYPDLAPQDEAPANTGLPDFGAMAAAGGGAAAGSGAFDFTAGGGPAPSSSVTARTKGKKGGKKSGARGKKGGGSPHIDYIAYAFYAIGAMNILMCLIILIMGMSGAALVSGADAEGAAAAAGIMGTIVVVASLFGALISCVYLAAGYGLQQRAGWGRMTAIVLGVLAMPGIPLGTAFGIWCWVVLNDKDNAAVFS